MVVYLLSERLRTGPISLKVLASFFFLLSALMNINVPYYPLFQLADRHIL